MIRINLLPHRLAKRKENIRMQLTILVLLVVMASIVMGGLYFRIKGKVANVALQINAANEEIINLDKEIGELAKLEDKVKVLKSKLEIIKDLEKKKAGPLNLFKGLSEAKLEKMWLVSVSEKGKKVDISGVAMDNETIAAFMKRLENYKYFKSVDLINITKTKSGTTEMKAFKMKVSK